MHLTWATKISIQHQIMMIPVKFKTYPSTKARWTHFAINLTLALGVIAILLVMENTIFFKEKRDYLLDHIMYWQSDQAAETDRLARGLE